MKVIGGSFGADGKAEIGSQNIVINGELVGRPKIESMTARQHSERGFSVLALLSGLLVIIPLCGWIFGLWGALAAFVFTMFATFDYSESRLVTIAIEGGKSATIQCKKKEAARLMEFAPK